MAELVKLGLLRQDGLFRDAGHAACERQHAQTMFLRAGCECLPARIGLAPPMEVIEAQARELIEDFDEHVFFARCEPGLTGEVVELALVDSQAFEDIGGSRGWTKDWLGALSR